MPRVKTVIELCQAIYSFQSRSVLRSEEFERAQSDLGYKEILKLPQTNDTRWSSKKKGLFYFRRRFDAVVAALTNIGNSGKIQDVAEARGYLSLLKSFENLLLVVCLDELLGCTNSLSEHLQSSDLLYARAIELSEATVVSLEQLKSGEKFDSLWQEAAVMAEKVHVEVASSSGSSRKGQRLSNLTSEGSDCLLVSHESTYKEQLSQIHCQVYVQAQSISHLLTFFVQLSI